MTRASLRGLLWHEWRITRIHWLLYGVLFHLPMVLSVLFSRFWDRMASDGATTLSMVLHVALTYQTQYALLFGVIIIPILVTHTVSGAFDTRGQFYFFEQPLSRRVLWWVKVASQGIPAMVLGCGSLVVSMVVVYAGLDASRTDTAALESALVSGLRGMVWMSLTFLVYIGVSFLFGALTRLMLAATLLSVVTLLVLNLMAIRSDLGWWIFPFRQTADRGLYAPFDVGSMAVVAVVGVMGLMGAWWLWERKEQG